MLASSTKSTILALAAPAYLALFLLRWTVYSMLGGQPNLIAVYHISRSSPREHTRPYTLPDLRERRLRDPLTRSPPGGVRRRYDLVLPDIPRHIPSRRSIEPPDFC